MRRSFVSVVSLVLTVLAGLALFPGVVVAQASPQASPKPCTSQEHRRFDFWLGTWEVVNRLQKQPGPPSVNRISLEENGCVIAEHYTSARGGYSGRSLSFYDARRNLWHQTWIDNRGQALYLEGRYEERDGHGALVLAGEKPDGTLDRVTWRPLRNGKVQQLWEVSKDAGETWKAVFDGLYTRKGQ